MKFIFVITGSDIYEDPRVRFEYKRIIPLEPVHMETYLVRILSTQFQTLHVYTERPVVYIRIKKKII